jgi:hypothetical protein
MTGQTLTLYPFFPPEMLEALFEQQQASQRKRRTGPANHHPTDQELSNG